MHVCNFFKKIRCQNETQPKHEPNQTQEQETFDKQHPEMFVI